MSFHFVKITFLSNMIVTNNSFQLTRIISTAKCSPEMMHCGYSNRFYTKCIIIRI